LANRLLPTSGWLHRLAATRSQKILEATTLSIATQSFSAAHMVLLFVFTMMLAK